MNGRTWPWIPRASTPEERSRRDRWAAKGAAEVTHPVFGTVVVPCASPFSAIKCAAEVWGCSWKDITNAGVWRTEPADLARK